MYYLGQAVKLIWEEKTKENNIGIILYKELVIPSNKKDADKYYGVLAYMGDEEEPVVYLFTSDKLEYLYDKNNKVYWGKTKTNKLAKVDTKVNQSKAHLNELERIVKSDLTELNEIEL